MLKSCRRHCLHFFLYRCCLALPLLSSSPNTEVDLRDSYNLQRHKKALAKYQFLKFSQGAATASKVRYFWPSLCHKCCWHCDVFIIASLLGRWSLAVATVVSGCRQVKFVLLCRCCPVKRQKVGPRGSYVLQRRICCPLTLLAKNEDKNWWVNSV